MIGKDVVMKYILERNMFEEIKWKIYFGYKLIGLECSKIILGVLNWMMQCSVCKQFGRVDEQDNSLGCTTHEKNIFFKKLALILSYIFYIH